ncbi:MAG: PBP1A family penicillin-binding protein [Thermodesulfobacteriota bacterium]
MPPAKSTKKRPVQPAKTKKRVYKKPLNEKHIIGFFFAIALSLSLFLGGLLLILVLLRIPDIRNVTEYAPVQASEIIDRHGRVVERIYAENRTLIPLSNMPTYLPQAFIAAEDSRFYAHPGLDLWSVFRAAINNLKSGGRGQGGSTITQQVAKSLLLTPEKTYLRKFKEAILAWRIDTLLSKDDVLYIYLNQIYLGGSAHGVEAASQFYFAKHARDLNLGEAALLGGLPQAPSRYAPHRHLEAARKRQRYVLNRMAADGYVSSDEARAAFERPLRIVGGRKSAHGVNGYFVQLVRKQAEQILGTSLNRAGVRIYTTMDSGQQKEAARVLRHGVAEHFPGQNKVQGAIVSLDACSGRVRALTGGLDFNTSAFDRATLARRSAGSLFKPILYSGAFAKGFSPDSTINDEPISVRGGNGKLWQPRNFSGRHFGETTLREGLINSRNIVAIKLLQQVGIKPVQSLAEDFGIRPPITSDLSLALGTTGVSLLEITAAYSPFVCGGKYVAPILITAIDRNDGQRVYRAQAKSRQTITPGVAAEMKGLLTQVVERGTGRRAAGLPAPTGGKTGTTNENRDAWFVGFTTNRLGGVWLGRDDNTSLGKGKSGGAVAAPIWHDFMDGSGAQ